MKLNKKYHSKFELISIAIFICIFIWLLMSGIFRESAVYDEKLHLDAGHIFLTKHDFRAEPFNPPFAREIIALPSIFDLKTNNDPILFYPRLMTVIIATIFSLYFYWFSRKTFGRKSATFSLFLFIFEPEILAHGHYATTDFLLAFLVFVSISLYYLWHNSLNLKRISILSVTVGLALATKISALPFLLFSYLIIFGIKKRIGLKDLIKLSYWMNKAKFILIFCVLSGLVIWATYFFTLEPLLGYRFDPNRMLVKLNEKNSIVNFALNIPVPLGGYVSTIKQDILYNYAPYYIKTSFLNGQILQNGSPFFFPIAFLLKTPLPLIFLLILALFTIVKSNKANLFLLVTIISIFASSMVSTLNLGIRYILSVYPFIILLSAQVINLKFKYKKLLIGVLSVWYMLGVANVFPHYISFFNELAGGPRNGYKYLVDSNYDWGQGLIDLKEYQDKYRINDLRLAYFGTVDPVKYGIKYKGINKENITSLKPGKNYLIAISASCWYFCGYYKNPHLNKENPYDIVGGSILIFKK